MKFSHSIQLNASPEWRDEYLAYSHLKKVIYAIEKATLGLAPLPDSHRDISTAAATAIASGGRGSHAVVGGDLEASGGHDGGGSGFSPTGDGRFAGERGGRSPTAGAEHLLVMAPQRTRRTRSGSSDASFTGGRSVALTIDGHDGAASETTPLLQAPGIVGVVGCASSALTHAEANEYFQRALDEELDKIVAFYTAKESELLESVDAIAGEVAAVERDAEAQLLGAGEDALGALHAHGDDLAAPPINEFDAPASVTAATPASTTFPGGQTRHRLISATGDDAASPISVLDSAPRHPSYLPVLLWASRSLKAHRSRFQKRAISLFVVLCELRDYVDIHITGFSKILKKYEKVVGAKLKRIYLLRVDSAYPFLTRTKERLARAIDQVVHLYARIATEGKLAIAQTELRSHLRDYIVWERNTIWRDMIEQERRRETIGIRANAMAGGDRLSAPRTVTVRVCGTSLHLPAAVPTSALVCAFAVLLLFAIIQSAPLATPEQNGCLAILVFASVLWALEALPLFITSMLIPLLVVALRVLRKDNVRLNSKAAAKQIFSDMFGPVIMLLLGGFSLAGALSKHNIAKEAAAVILGRAGSRPHWVILANMFVSTFASMWISNVAAPVLCFSLVTPILRNLPRRSPYARCLVIGIAMAANVGGMASPISSPQNIIAMANMSPPPSWLEWFTIALPVCLILDAIIWLVLIAVYRPTESESAAPPELYGNAQLAAASRKWTATQIYVLVVSAITIVLWCAENRIESIVGDMGVIAIVPIVAFYGTGVLTKDDWNSMLWSVVMLAMGGIALGKAVESSGLLMYITHHLAPALTSLPIYYCLAILTAVVVIVTSFISHTVGALIILPVVQQIGATLPDPRARTFVMASALLCSGGMALPVSSFPNMNAISLEDPTGSPWLTVSDFIRVGVVSTVAAWVCVMTVGYMVMTAMEFN